MDFNGLTPREPKPLMGAKINKVRCIAFIGPVDQDPAIAKIKAER
jgi:hypothetical protein